MAVTDAKLAVFIDCENADLNLIPKLFAGKPELAKASIKRGYGVAATLHGWSDVLRQYSFQPRLTPPSAKPVNASDFALVIDCLDLMYASRFDTAWLVTSDADFTQLAAHLRSYGIRVGCAGRGINRSTFRGSFDEFVDYYADNEASPTTPDLPQNDALVARLIALHNELLASNPNGVRVSTFGNHYPDRPPGFEAGSGKLRLLLEGTRAFSVQNGIMIRARANGHG